jgi:hypothetical protein
MKIDERIDDDGQSVITEIDVRDGLLCVAVGARIEGDLPLEIVDHVMLRYARPLADGIALTRGGPALDLGHGRSLVMLRHRARYDVIARDFIVLVRPGAEPLAELATTIAGALAHLARAAHAARA